MGIPPLLKADGSELAQGRVFPITLDEVEAAALLIANVSSNDISVDVFVGTQGGVGQGVHTMPLIQRRGMWRVDLRPEEENSHLVVVASGGDIVVQLMMDDGRVYGVTCPSV